MREWAHLRKLVVEIPHKDFVRFEESTEARGCTVAAMLVAEYLAAQDPAE